MKKFVCTKCQNPVYFENVQCVRCGSPLGFDPNCARMVTLETLPDGTFRIMGERQGQRLSYCANAQYGTCNWLTPSDDGNPLCSGCELNRMIPDLGEPGNIEAWGQLELAKKRLLYSLIRFGLPFNGGGPSNKEPMTFNFAQNTVTGHLDGAITIGIEEADSVERERQRRNFDERYRTLLGHLRHESGHYYWMLLIEDSSETDRFRELFGDERQDYAAALARNQEQGPPPNWQASYVSAYASVHPWEDWAESWAHYLHMADALDTAEAQGLEPRAAGFVFGSIWPFKTYDIHREETFDALIERWVPLTLALNSLNRSMGHMDFYPFVTPPPAIAKLGYIHDLIRRSRVPI